MRCIMCTLLAKIRLFIFSPMYFSCSKMFFVGSHAYDVRFDNLCRFLQWHQVIIVLESSFNVSNSRLDYFIVMSISDLF